MKRALKWVGFVLGGLLGLIILALIAIFIISSSRMNKQYDIRAEVITVPVMPWREPEVSISP